MTINKSAVTLALIGAGVAALTVFDPIAPTPLAAQVREVQVGAGNTEDYGVDWSKVNLGGERREDIRERMIAHKPDPVKYPIPRTKWDGKPDLNGAYGDGARMGRPAANLESLYRKDVMPLRAKTDVINWANGFENPTFHCWPRPILNGSQGNNSSIQVIHSPGMIAFIDEQDGRFRIVPLVDGPAAVKHNPSHKPSYMGDSIGYWEGDTLVVDITNFNGRPWLGGIDESKTPPTPPQTSSDALHIVEHWTMVDGKMFEYQAVRVEDPKMLTGPYTGSKTRREKQTYDQIQEALCQELPELVQKEEENLRLYGQSK